MTRFTLPRYIPNGAIKVADKASDAVAYLYSDNRARPCARVFYGRQSNPVVYCYYRSEVEREAAVRRAFEVRRLTHARRAEVAEERKAYNHSFKVGDVVNTCWGYEQTNREYFEVVGVRGKSVVTLRQIAVDSYDTSSMSGYVVPLPGKYVGEAKDFRANSYGGIKISACRTAHKTDFKEVAPGVRAYNAGYVSSYA
jgi:hypothetical protein